VSELRHDRLHQTWVVIAPGRGARPRDILLRSESAAEGACPFCPGQEHETPPEVLATGRPAGGLPNTPPWRVRVFPNRYPAVTGAAGRHEVVVLSPRHDDALADLAPAELREFLAVARDRVDQLERDGRLRAVTVFLNSGAGAGASLSHPHGQILATPEIPAVLRAEVAAHAQQRAVHGDCLLCDLAEEARRDGRVVHEDDAAVTFAPRASRFSWEMHIAPRRCRARLADASADELDAVAIHLGAACRALRAAAADPAYNLVLHTSPSPGEDFHWHVELMPRLAPLAGFEAGTGFFINPVAPEDAARMLRVHLTLPQEGPRP
jgi:UDPglucose--hexose-1-phosphate uridylyltransferase